jgi:dUTP pyrophosphatase
MKSEEILAINEKLQRAINPDDSYTFEDFYNDYAYAHEVNVEDVIKNGFTTIGDYDVSKVKINYVNKSNNENPEYATSGSAGFDLRSNVNVTIQPGEFDKVPTGLYFELPPNYEMQVRPRSGLSAKHGVTVLNSPGTIDSDYRGEIIVILINHGKEPFKIEVGDRIAQGVIAQTLTNFIKLNNVSEISDNTERSSGGFGSTGIK